MPETSGPLAFPPHSAGQEVPNPFSHAFSATNTGPRGVLLPNPQNIWPLKATDSSWHWQGGGVRGEEMQGHIRAPGIWGWPGSSLRCSLPQQVLLTLPLYARTLHPSALVHLLMSVPTVASPLASCFLPLPLCNPFFPLQPQPAFQSKTQITLPPCVNPSGGFLSSKE